jgi:hypothetical protein
MHIFTMCTLEYSAFPCTLIRIGTWKKRKLLSFKAVRKKLVSLQLKSFASSFLRRNVNVIASMP